MRQYRLVMKISPDPATWESHTIERDSLEDCLRDEPEWRGLLRVEEIELSAEYQSVN